MNFFGKKLKVAVIGDSIIDEYIECEVTRISPEAPVPVAKQLYKRWVAGGALNVAANFLKLGNEVELFTCLGSDFTHYSQTIPQGLTFKRSAVSDLSPTVKKSRICCGNKQLLRLDCDGAPASSISGLAFSDEVIDCLTSEHFDIIALADYGLKVLSWNKRMAQVFQKLSKKSDVMIALDPHPRNFDLLSHRLAGEIRIDFIKPNENEARAIASQFGTSANVDDLSKTFGIPKVLVTNGSKGMLYYDADKDDKIFQAASNIQVFDVSGAGDAVFATVTSAFCSGVDPVKALNAATLAARTVITKFGTASLDIDELASFYQNH